MRLASGVVSINVSTGGASYASPPSVSLSGGGGTGASAVAQMAGTVVESVLITNPGKDYTATPSVSFTPSGAAATASILSYGGTNVISLFKGRGNDMYGVDGRGRGFRWDGDSEHLEPLGITRPLSAPTIAVTTGGSSGAVRSIAIVNGGAGYHAAPTVVFSGGGLTDGSTQHAKARAKISGARVVGMTVDDRGGHYTSAPQITLDGGVGTGATLTVGVAGVLTNASVSVPGTGYTISPECVIGGGVASVTITSGGTNYTSATVAFASVSGGSAAGTCSVTAGRVTAIHLTDMWAGYASPPAVTISGDGTGAAATCSLDGLTSARALVSVGGDGQLTGLQILHSGTGGTTTPGIRLVSATTVSSTTGGSTTLTVGSGGVLVPVMSYTVKSVTVTTGGTGYMAPPAIGFRPTDGGALASASVSNGSVSSVTVLAGGVYSEPPTAVTEPTQAKAIAVVTQPMAGRYKCCIRYLDDTPVDRGGPIPSNISDFVIVDVEDESSQFVWRWSNNGMESRVSKIELWRTTADQELVLYRVALLSPVDGVLPNTYTESLSDNDLLDADRSDFGIMPIVMPNGQLNAKRFVPPPTKCAVACVFQDRAWYTADTTGAKPNSLWYSEIDEPESAPEVNEIVLQENASDSDYIVGAVPFGSALLVLQSRHLYKLQYVAQPIIDASVMLMAYRGALNSRCVDIYDGVAFIVDAYGMYAFDGSSQDSISVPIDTYWRDGIIDFSKSKYFHVRVTPQERVVRFYYCTAADGIYPTRALCFCIGTKAWWEETYPKPHASSVPVLSGGAVRILSGGDGEFSRPAAGVRDYNSTDIPYEMRTGNFSLTPEPSRAIGVLYKPTPQSVQVRLHYNGSSSPRPNAISSDRGDGFVTVHGSTAATLNMASDRSALGAAPGYSKARFSGRFDERSAGGDKHVAIAVGGSQGSGAQATIYTVTVEGATV